MRAIRSLWLAALLTLSGCGGQQAAVRWFDILAGDDRPRDGAEYQMEALPGVTLRYQGELTAVTGEETRSLYTGMPIWSVYLCDLNGDGIPEVCSTVSYGSGLIDQRVMVYDLAAEAAYTLEDRGTYDYILTAGEDGLKVERRLWGTEEAEETGSLLLADGVLFMEAG